MHFFVRFWVRGKPLKQFHSFIMSASNEKVYYAVGRGREIGIYDSWKECKAQTDGVANAKYRKFYSLEEAKEFVSFWKNYSGKDSVESKNSADSDDNMDNHCEVKVEPAPEPEPAPALTQLKSPSHALPRPSSPHTLVYEGRVLSHNEVDVLAVNLRLDSLEKRFDSCLKEFGAMTSEISRLVTAVNELKESLKSSMGTSPKKGKDGLYQTTLSFGTGDSPSRYFSSQKDAGDPDEPDCKRGRSLKRRLSRRGSQERPRDEEEFIEKLCKKLRAEEVDMSSFNVDDDGFVEVYTDGSSLSNGKPDAKAGIGVWFGDDHPLNVAEPVVGNATNVTAEIQAARVAVELASRAGVNKLKVLTDSEFLINCITKWIHRWKKNGWTLSKGGPVKNRGELEKLDSAASKITVRWEKVLAHSKIKGNETADRLANRGAARYDR